MQWVKNWIGQTVKASPEASIAWACICVVIPLLTNATTADEAHRDGFTYVTTRMRYYTALEPLLMRLGQVPVVSHALMAETVSHVVTLYQHILEFLIRSILKLHLGSFEGFVKDTFVPVGWKPPVHSAAVLLRNGANIDARDYNNRTAVWHAAANSFDSEEAVRSIRLLGESGADLDARDEDGASPLDRASSERVSKKVQALIEWWC